MKIDSDRLSSRFGIMQAMDIYEQIRDKNSFLIFAQYLHHSDRHVSRNAAWVLTHCNDEELAWLQPFQDKLMDLVLSTPNTSLRRLTLNLLERMTYDADTLRTDFLDFCLEHMQSLEEPSGVQTLCMKLAYRQCILYPELKDELFRTLQAMQADYYLPGVRCTIRRILNGKFK